MREERPQIAGSRIWYPDGGEAIMAQQVEDMQGVALIRLRLADDHGANLRGIADEERVPEALHDRVKPDAYPGSQSRRSPAGPGRTNSSTAVPSCGSRCSPLPGPVSSTATCCMRVCRSYPTNAAASAPRGELSPMPSIATAQDRSHDISDVARSSGRAGSSPGGRDRRTGIQTRVVQRATSTTLLSWRALATPWRRTHPEPRTPGRDITGLADQSYELTGNGSKCSRSSPCLEARRRHFCPSHPKISGGGQAPLENLA